MMTPISWAGSSIDCDGKIVKPKFHFSVAGADMDMVGSLLSLNRKML